jgi:hypothetical protein
VQCLWLLTHADSLHYIECILGVNMSSRSPLPSLNLRASTAFSVLLLVSVSLPHQLYCSCRTVHLPLS